jgi:hypothetical protein
MESGGFRASPSPTPYFPHLTPHFDRVPTEKITAIIERLSRLTEECAKRITELLGRTEKSRENL